MKIIITKYLEGKATEAEQKVLLEWLREKENRHVFNRVKSEWKNNTGTTQISAEATESWNRIQDRLMQKSYSGWQESRKIQQYLRIAAIFFFVVSLGISGWFISQKSWQANEVFTRVVAENGQISKVELPDGTEVWLNSGSEISYGSRFSTQNRNIVLQGEAYFQAAKNEALPLVVSAGELQVKVLGTKFNVNAYANSGSVDVVLEEGSVELLNSKVASFNFILKPGELAKFDISSRQLVVSQINPERVTSWKDGILNIYDQTMVEVVKRLETRYNQKFELTDEIKNFRYTFTITNEPLDEIIRLMEKITPIKAIQKEDVIVFEADKNKIKTAVR